MSLPLKAPETEPSPLNPSWFAMEYGEGFGNGDAPECIGLRKLLCPGAESRLFLLCDAACDRSVAEADKSVGL